MYLHKTMQYCWISNVSVKNNQHFSDNICNGLRKLLILPRKKGHNIFKVKLHMDNILNYYHKILESLTIQVYFLEE